MAEVGARSFEGSRVLREDWPIVVIEYGERRVADETHRALLAYVESLMSEARSKHEKIFVVTDLTRMLEFNPASQRRDTAEWIKRTAALTRAGSVGAAHVTPSAILRGLITAVFWFNKPPTPSVFVATRREAVVKGIQMLEEAGQRLPPHLVALRDRSAKRAG
jgi:hypothetical protein